MMRMVVVMFMMIMMLVVIMMMRMRLLYGRRFRLGWCMMDVMRRWMVFVFMRRMFHMRTISTGHGSFRLG